MSEIISDVRDFVADRPWGARDLALVDGATVRLHWTNEPYHWHVNDGPEVFVVLDGRVRMRTRSASGEAETILGPGDIFVADVGDEHLAEPLGDARVLVVERAGSE